MQGSTVLLGMSFKHIKDLYREPLNNFFVNIQNYLTEQTFIMKKQDELKTKVFVQKVIKKEKLLVEFFMQGT